MALAVPLVIITAVLVPAVRSRRKYKTAMRMSELGLKEESVALGSHEQIADGGAFSVAGLRKAMAIAPEDHGPTEDEPHDEGWAATMLGLKSQISYATEVLEPHIYWGDRELGQVFIRLGPDEKVAGGTELYSNKHIRQITVLRVAAPDFALGDRGGKPAVTAGAAPGIERVLDRIDPRPGAWTDMAALGGDEGIVLERPAATAPEFWIYDLWLVETIARELQLPALMPARIGPSWEIPYGAGKAAISG